LFAYAHVAAMGQFSPFRWIGLPAVSRKLQRLSAQTGHSLIPGFALFSDSRASKTEEKDDTTYVTADIRHVT